jgi:hypothetical protein
VKVIRSGSGLGDSIYLRPVAEHFVRTGASVTVKSDYPGVFAGAGVIVDAFTRQGCNVVAHYSQRRHLDGSNQWQDICTSAQIPQIPLAFHWEVKNRPLLQGLKSAANGRPIVMINGGRHPMGRKDGYGREMLPTPEAFDAVLSALQDCFVVEVGKGDELYPLRADVDLTDRTSPADLLDIATLARGLVGQCSFMIPLAEVFDKPLLAVWASAGLVSATPFIRQCTPKKVLTKPTSRFVLDQWPVEEITAVADEFRSVL